MPPCHDLHCKHSHTASISLPIYMYITRRRSRMYPPGATADKQQRCCCPQPLSLNTASCASTSAAHLEKKKGGLCFVGMSAISHTEGGGGGGALLTRRVMAIARNWSKDSWWACLALLILSEGTLAALVVCLCWSIQDCVDIHSWVCSYSSRPRRIILNITSL